MTRCLVRTRMQFPSRIRLFSAPVNWPQLIRETYSECFHKKKKREKFSNEFSKIKILNLKERRKEGGRNAWKVEKLEIERYYSTSKNVIYIYIYMTEWRATFLGRDWEEFLPLSLSLFGNGVFVRGSWESTRTETGTRLSLRHL